MNVGEEMAGILKKRQHKYLIIINSVDTKGCDKK